ncbi:MAG: hypothetical protein ACQGVK_05635 [Myxococcota bacterium]
MSASGASASAPGLPGSRAERSRESRRLGWRPGEERDAGSPRIEHAEAAGEAIRDRSRADEHEVRRRLDLPDHDVGDGAPVEIAPTPAARRERSVRGQMIGQAIDVEEGRDSRNVRGAAEPVRQEVALHPALDDQGGLDEGRKQNADPGRVSDDGVGEGVQRQDRHRVTRPLEASSDRLGRQAREQVHAQGCVGIGRRHLSSGSLAFSGGFRERCVLDSSAGRSTRVPDRPPFALALADRELDGSDRHL